MKTNNDKKVKEEFISLMSRNSCFDFLCFIHRVNIPYIAHANPINFFFSVVPFAVDAKGSVPLHIEYGHDTKSAEHISASCALLVAASGLIAVGADLSLGTFRREVLLAVVAYPAREFAVDCRWGPVVLYEHATPEVASVTVDGR